MRDSDCNNQLTDRLFAELVGNFLARDQPPDEAREHAEEILATAISACEFYGEIDKTPDPEWLFRAAEHDADAAAYLVEAGHLGVADQNIRQWHALPYLERSVIWTQIESDQLQVAFFCRAEGEARGTDMFTYAAFWHAAGRPQIPEFEVFPLPIELFLRVKYWARTQCLTSERVETLVRPYGTFNDFVRAEIRAGNL